MANTTKRYPFSMRKEGHNIELAYNFLRCEYTDMICGDKAWDQKTVDEFERLRDIYSAAISVPVYWATGKEYGILREASMWAELRRDKMNGK